MKPTPEKKKTKHTIRAKIFTAFLLVIVITLALLWLAQVVLFDLVYSNVRINEVKTTARHVKLYLDDATFFRILADATGKTDMCAEIIAEDGSTLYDAENTATCLIHALTVSEKQELVRMAKNGALYSVSFNPVTEEYDVDSLSGSILTGATNIVYVEQLEHNGSVFYLVLDAAVAPDEDK